MNSKTTVTRIRLKRKAWSHAVPTLSPGHHITRLKSRPLSCAREDAPWPAWRKDRREKRDGDSDDMVGGVPPHGICLSR